MEPGCEWWQRLFILAGMGAGQLLAINVNGQVEIRLPI